MGSEIKQKRQRSKNFTPEEEYAIIALVEEKRNIIENKKSDAITWNQKKQAWSHLASKYARKTGIHRTAHALKIKYENIKKKSKSEPNQNKSEIFLTTDNLLVKNDFSNTLEKRIEMNDESATGGGIYDNDSFINDPIAINHLEDLDEVEKKYEIPMNRILDESKNVEEATEESSFNKTYEEVNGIGIMIDKKVEHNAILEQEQFCLTRARRIFYEQENVRAERKHQEEIETLKVKRQKDLKAIELLELQIAEKKALLSQT